uniref:Uncharacterized protein n=1 Tax=Rhizophora mucronata TaxID=61149 RepID=A0A2P2R072_RHIMU
MNKNNAKLLKRHISQISSYQKSVRLKETRKQNKKGET